MFKSERDKPALSNDRARKLTSNLICLLPRMMFVSTQAFSSMQPSASQTFCVAAPLEKFPELVTHQQKQFINGIRNKNFVY